MSEIENIRKKVINYNLSLKSIIQDIKECTGPMDVLNGLNEKGRHNISDIQKCLDRLKVIVNEELQENVKRTLQLELNSFLDELLTTRNVFKKATLACIFQIEKSTRNELLGQDTEDLVNHRKKKDKDQLVKMSSNVTDRLLSISRTLSDTTQRSADTLGTLVTSSGVVDSTREELDSQGNVISQSSKLLAKYGRREQTDKFLIIFAAAFFFSCVAYILQKRLF